ncbi:MULTISPECIES: hypothetical protein [unclassified Caballeronia]|uniref:hypothetical protein n=1 Tax=unclassified Caballeronia TaxID=2646786 RepID=UPI0028654FC3|nr:MULTISPECIES: hypothetical protein [unclassified Caballeronia]MDR5741337.1 hypothetical protein [Caballeronia sp. LZ016]MDR5807234.1 hypothetical protein [Caballeronia sp. LZ019]
MNPITPITRMAVLGAVVAAMSLTAGCKRGSDNAAGGAASDTSAASAPMASAPAATSFPATAASDAPAGASQ